MTRPPDEHPFALEAPTGAAPEDRGDASLLPFEIERQIGAGGYGQVFLARDPQLDRPVALKVIRPELLAGDQADGIRRRFLQEARAAATLVHPGIATIFSVGEHEGRPYLAMEYLEGEDLESHLARSGPLQAADVVDIGLQLLDALGAAHDAGIVHRDIKPSNLMRRPDGTIKVTDFGIARLAGRELIKTQVGSLIATPQFASPEQLGGEQLDARSDLFSVGILVYHLLSGQFPFHARSLAELFRQTLFADPTPLTEHGVAAAAPWDSFLSKALAKKPEHRFQAAAEMARALRSLAPVPSSHTSPTPATADRNAPTLPMRTPLEADLLPASVFQASSAGTAHDLIWELASSWEERDLGTQNARAVLPRLLEVPLHTEAYRGALQLGEHTQLFLSEGQIVGSLSTAGLDSEIDGTARLPQRLLTPPAEQSCLVPLVGSFLLALQDGEGVEQRDLQASFVDLPRLLGALLADAMPRVVQIQAVSGQVLVFVHGGRLDVVLPAVFAAPGRDDAVAWADWFGSLDATLTIWRPRSQPDPAWYRLAFADTGVRIAGTRDLAQQLNLTTSGRSPKTADWQASVQISPDSQSQASVVDRALTSPAAAQLHWLLRTAPPLLTEGDRRREWKYLAQWIADVDRATLYHRPEGATHAFDAVTADDSGKILHLLHGVDHLDAQALERLTDQVAEVKERHGRRGDVGALVVFAHEISEDAVASYRQLMYRGRSNAWFGVDQSLGYRGFVRLSARRGYHLLLARVDDAIDHAVPLWQLAEGGAESNPSL